MASFEATFPHLKAQESPLHADIGRNVRFKVPADRAEREQFVCTYGAFAVQAVYEIVGVQKNHRGELCYRIAADGDDFGRAANPDKVEFVHEH